MTRDQFFKYLDFPEGLNGHSIAALEKLVQEYPYFQMGRMLYLKNLHNENSIDYEKNLPVTSAYAPSGKVLYNLIKKQVLKKEVGSWQLAVSNESQELTFNEILPKEDPVVIPQEIPMTDKKEKKDEYDELLLMEKEMLKEAQSISMTIDLPEKNPESTVKQGISDTYSFNDWLKVVSGKIPESVKEDAIIQRKVKTGIIDNYILEETAKSIPKSKTEFYSAEVMAKKSIQDDETFITETLARIYLKQGNLPKALRSYEILLVRYPEKIHIFAPLLEKIKKLLKQQ